MGATDDKMLVEAQCGIYAFVNIVTGKMYVGSSANCKRRYLEHRSRLRRGVHINKKFQSSWDKHGEEAFSFFMLFCVIAQEDLESVEQIFLDSLNVVSSGYNLAPVAGNTFGWKASIEIRQRMSRRQRNVIMQSR